MILPASAQAAPTAFRVGAAEATINPSYPAYMGGYAGGQPGGTIARHTDPLTGRPEDLTVRAIAITSGQHVLEFATVDTQGYFAGYQEGPYGISDVRGAVARGSGASLPRLRRPHGGRVHADDRGDRPGGPDLEHGGLRGAAGRPVSATAGAVSGFHCSFGDGTTALTAPQVFSRAWFSPFIAHATAPPAPTT